MRMIKLIANISATILVTCAGAASAAETRSYTYDGRGRLTTVTVSGTVNNNRATTYCHDKASNRTQVVSDQSGTPAQCSAGAPTCLLATSDQSGNDSSATTYVLKVGSCPFDITLGYSIQYVSGTGSYWDKGFWYGTNIMSASQIGLGMGVGAGGIDNNDPLILHITYTTTTSGVAISPAMATLTIYSAD